MALLNGLALKNTLDTYYIITNIVCFSSEVASGLDYKKSLSKPNVCLNYDPRLGAFTWKQLPAELDNPETKDPDQLKRGSVPYWEFNRSGVAWGRRIEDYLAHFSFLDPKDEA